MYRGTSLTTRRVEFSHVNLFLMFPILTFPSLNPYGLTISLALLVAYWLTAYRAGKRGLSSDLVWDSLPWVVFSGLIGARLYHVANYLTFYIEHLTLILQIWRGGLGIYGGLAGGLLGFITFVKFKVGNKRKFSITNDQLPMNFQFSIFNYLDAAAPGIALGQAIGRVGNIFNGENLPFAYWEIVADIFVFLTLIVLDQRSKISSKGGSASGGKDQNFRSKIKNGELFYLYLLSYSVTRFALEFFRTDSPWIAGPLTMAQWVSLAIVIAVFIKVVSLAVIKV